MAEFGSIPVEIVPPAPSGTGCVECEAADGWWWHLRRCVECGHVGCCDDSLERHARGHFAATGHRYVRSFEPNEHWFWDYADDVQVEGPDVPPPLAHPDEQTSPGPADRLPEDWQRRLALRRRAEQA